MMLLLWVARFISAIGAINWGTVVFFNLNLVDQAMAAAQVYNYRKYAYGIVAIAGFYSLLALFMYG